MGNCYPVPHIFQRSSTLRASSAPVPGTSTLRGTLATGPELALLQGKHYAVPGMVPLPVHPGEAVVAAEALGKELTRSLYKTGVPIDLPFLDDLTVNFGIGLADDPRIAQMMVATSEDDEWADG